jgi:DNA (cytosine-5)-methyltransferase 1
MAPGQLSMVSLFTGAGGLDAGLDTTGKFNLLAAAEWDSASCRTLEMNRDAGRFGTPNTRIYEADLSVMDPHQLLDDLGLKPGELDVLVGGPPCQSFSTAGRRGTVQDPRGQMLWHFLRFLEVLRPKMFLVENVRGLLSAALRHRPIADRPANGGAPLTADEEPGSAVRAWIADLLALNGGEYRVDSFEVNAVNYGAPQLRERVLFIGNRLGHTVKFPAPTHGSGEDGLLPFRTLADALDGFTEEAPVLMDFSPRKKSFLAYVPEGGNWRAMPEHLQQESMGRAFYAKGGRSGWWRRLSWDLPSPTITTMPNHSSTSMCHPSETRVLSVGECARLQEFPDGWIFAGTAAQQMKQVGNAVPARLGMVAGDLIAAHLQEAEADRPPIVDLTGWTNTYLRSHVRTRSWWKNGQAVVRERQLAS